MSKRWTAAAMGVVMMLTLTGIANAVKPIEIVAGTKFFFFLDGAGKVPKKDTHSIGVLEDYDAPIYYCWFAFHDFAKADIDRLLIRGRPHERTEPGVELTHALGDHVHQHGHALDALSGSLEQFDIHAQLLPEDEKQ